MLLTKFIWIFISYLFGALPLAVWTGRRAGHDIRDFGDGNPGATNVLRAAGLGWGIVAYGLEFSKAAVPVGLANFTFGWGAAPGWERWLLVPIALAPSIGHAYSVFLGWRGGKALATIFGAWIGLTLIEVPAVILILIVFFFLLLDNDGWAVLLTGTLALVYLLVFRPDPVLLAVSIGQLFLVIRTHRADLARRPQLRERWRRLVQ